MMVFMKGLKYNKKGDMEEVIKIALWIFFTVVALGAVWFVLRALGLFA